MERIKDFYSRMLKLSTTLQLQKFNVVQMTHVQLLFFPSSNQSNSLYLELSLPLPSSIMWLPVPSCKGAFKEFLVLGPGLVKGASLELCLLL